MSGPRILVLDIETAPLLGYCWGLWDNNIALNQLHSDWYVLSWAAKWLGDPPSKVMYADQRAEPDLENDKKILKQMWNLLNEADIIITQNGKHFDEKKLKARFVYHDLPPYSPVRHIDTKIMAKRHFGFTSNKLEYMADKFNKKYKKSKHTRFEGFELWSECLKQNPLAFKEMEKYNKYDVLVLEELYYRLVAWDGPVNFSIYEGEGDGMSCHLCSGDIEKRGYSYTQVGKYQRYRCKDCGTWTRGRDNLLTPAKRRSLKVPLR